jgi:3-deoxy-D-manno-octulosonate 8-phosphate phosphatase (KDO 8-P phosphatase)
MQNQPNIEAKQIVKPDWFKKIRCLATDVDGVLTTGHIFYTSEQNWGRHFHIRDGMGLILLQKAGFQTAFITASQSPDIARRATDLKINHFFEGIKEKGAAFQELVRRTGLAPSEIAYIGDDVIDIPVFKECGLAIGVPDGHPATFEHVKYVTHARGGTGAVREICDYILKYSSSDKIEAGLELAKN